MTHLDMPHPDITHPDITHPEITHPDITHPDITHPNMPLSSVWLKLPLIVESKPIECRQFPAALALPTSDCTLTSPSSSSSSPLSSGRHDCVLSELREPASDDDERRAAATVSNTPRT